MNIFELVKAKVNIYDGLSRYLKLVKRGNNYLACCPFHQEKTPSFHVNIEKNYFYCFGCQAGGDVVNFIVKYHNISVKDAVNKLAAQFNIALPTSQHSNKYQCYLDLVLKVANYYHNSLTIYSIEYLEKRKINSYLRKVFMIGYSASVKNLVATQGVSERDCVELGLVKKSNYGNDTYDFFRDRIMFPIMNAKGQVLAFGGRVFNGNKKVAKYINSSESNLFRKREVFYGEYQAWDNIISSKKVYIVEGYLDCIRMHQFGYKNTLSTSGTAVSIEHLQRLVMLKEVIFCFDSDKAGLKAVEKCLDIICEIVFPGMDFFFVQLPEGDDPDSFLLNHNQDAFDGLKRLSYIEMVFSIFDKQCANLMILHQELMKFSNKIKNISVKYVFDVQLKDFLWKKHRVKKNYNRTQYMLESKSISDGMLNSSFVNSQFKVSDAGGNSENNIYSGYDVLVLSILSIASYQYEMLSNNGFMDMEEFKLLAEVAFNNRMLEDVRLLIIDCYNKNYDIIPLIKEKYLVVYNMLNEFYYNKLSIQGNDMLLCLKIYIVKYCIVFYTDKYTTVGNVSVDLVYFVRKLNNKLNALEHKNSIN